MPLTLPLAMPLITRTATSPGGWLRRVLLRGLLRMPRWSRRIVAPVSRQAFDFPDFAVDGFDIYQIPARRIRRLGHRPFLLEKFVQFAQ